MVKEWYKNYYWIVGGSVKETDGIVTLFLFSWPSSEYQDTLPCGVCFPAQGTVQYVKERAEPQGQVSITNGVNTLLVV